MSGRPAAGLTHHAMYAQVLAIMVRYNLLNSEVVGPKTAFFLGVVAPWLVTMFCYQASMLTKICNWTAVQPLATSPHSALRHVLGASP